MQWAVLEGSRPRSCGRNARLGSHGLHVRVPVVRVTTSDGLAGFGLGRIDEDLAERVVGLPVSDVWDEQRGVRPSVRALDIALWDLDGRRSGQPVYRLLGGKDEPTSVSCYDTTLYFDDLDAGVADADHAAGAAVIAEEARAGYERGHRAFKVKVGRGGRWMAPDAGLDRDVAVVAAVRDAVGPECPVFTDANNGFTFNAARAFLARTAPHDVGWLEEPFHEDRVLFDALRTWMAEEGLSVPLADGESGSVEDCRRLAADHVVDIVQCDVLVAGVSGWVSLAPDVERAGLESAPHNFGLHLGNHVSAHLVGAIAGMHWVEWDEATTPGLDTSGYQLSGGRMSVPDAPGFGIELDETAFVDAVAHNGFDVRIDASARRTAQ